MTSKKIFLAIILFNFHLCYSQSNENLLRDVFKKVNDVAASDKSIRVDYVWKQKPLYTPKEFSSVVTLYADKTILNGDSLASFVLFFNYGFQYFFDDNLCKLDNANDISCFVKDTLNYFTNYDLITKSLQLFPQLIKFPALVINEEKIKNYSIKEEMVLSKNTYAITYSDSSQDGSYDSLYVFIDKESNRITKFKRALYDAEAADSEYKIFDSIVYSGINSATVAGIKDSLINGKTKTIYDPYNDLNKALIDTLIEFPVLDAYDVNGVQFLFSSLSSKFVLVDFTYSSCYYCLKSIPLLNELHKKFSKNDLSVIAIDPIDFDNVAYSDSLFRKKGAVYPIFYERSKEIRGKISLYPTLYLMDAKSNRILRSYVGYSGEIHKSILNDIESMFRK